MKITLFIIFSFGLVCLSQAANKCVFPPGQASLKSPRDGSDWEHAMNGLPVDLNRGDVYYLATGSYGGYTFDDGGTGVITVRKAIAGGDHGSSVGWSDSYGTGQALFGGISFNADNYIFDGVTGGGPGQYQSNLGFKIKSGGFNINFNGPRANIQILHVEAENNGRADAQQNEHSFYGTGGISNIRVAYCYFHDVSICFFFTRGANYITVEYSKFARNGQAEWIDGLHRTPWSATTDNHMVIRHNIFEDVTNTAVFSVVNGSGAADDWQIYGNTIVWTGNYPDAYCSALVDVRNDNALGVSPPLINMTASHWRIYNNNIINWIGGSSAGIRIGAGSDNLVYNNIWYKNIANELSFWSSTHDYNWFYGNIRTAGYPPGEPKNLDSTGEAHGQIGTGDPFESWSTGDFRLKATTNPGLSLPSPYNVDPVGNVRATWTRGAYEFAGTPSQPFVYHPADASPQDKIISLNEATSFGACWKSNCKPEATLDNAVRAGTLWGASANGQYQYNSAIACPLCWEIKP